MGNDRRDTEEETWFRQALRCLRGLGVEGFWVQGLGLIGSRGFLMVQILLDICIEINFGQE